MGSASSNNRANSSTNNQNYSNTNSTPNDSHPNMPSSVNSHMAQSRNRNEETTSSNPSNSHLILNQTYDMSRTETLSTTLNTCNNGIGCTTPIALNDNNRNIGVSRIQTSNVSDTGKSKNTPATPTGSKFPTAPTNQSQSQNTLAYTVAPSPTCLNTASEVNARLDTQVEVKVYPCNNNSGGSAKKKFTQFTVKPEGVIIQGTNRNRNIANDLGSDYALQVGRKLQRYELSDTRACQLLVTTHAKSFWVVPAPEAFSRHSGTCRLLGDRKHPLAAHTLQVGDFLRVGSVGVVVIETHNGDENRILSEEKIQKIMKDTASSSGGFLDLGETDGEHSDESTHRERMRVAGVEEDTPVCYMCFDDEHTEENPLITPCKCRGDTRYVHVGCLRKWHTAEADNQVCFLSSVDATCSVCKSTFKSDFKLNDGRLVKLFKSSLEPPYVSLLVATKHEMAQRLFNTRFQLSFSTLLKADGRNGTRPLFLGRSSGSDMVLDYRTVSARHATIKFKNNEFIFTDAGSSNGSYLYLRRPVELTAAQSVQFRLGRSMISMKIVNKWNRRLLRAVRRTSTSNCPYQGLAGDDNSVGSNEDDVRISDGKTGQFTRNLPRRSRESIMHSLPSPGMLSQQSPQHLDLLHALAYPKRMSEKDINAKKKDWNINLKNSDSELELEERKVDEHAENQSTAENYHGVNASNDFFDNLNNDEVTKQMNRPDEDVLDR